MTADDVIILVKKCKYACTTSDLSPYRQYFIPACREVPCPSSTSLRKNSFYYTFILQKSKQISSNLGVGDVCDLPMVEGSGKYKLLRYYFDKTSRNCREFRYKGSKGNENNFITRIQCQEACKRKHC